MLLLICATAHEKIPTSFLQSSKHTQEIKYATEVAESNWVDGYTNPWMDLSTEYRTNPDADVREEGDKVPD